MFKNYWLEVFRFEDDYARNGPIFNQASMLELKGSAREEQPIRLKHLQQAMNVYPYLT